MKKTKKKHYYKPSTKSPGLSVIQKSIIAIIIATMIIVVIAILLSFVFRPENVIKSKIETLATSYYEDTLYEQYLTPDGSTDGFTKYEKSGLPYVPLRQLIFTSNLDKNEIKQIRGICDENKTSIKYYPEPPYTKTSYRIEYTYNCNF